MTNRYGRLIVSMFLLLCWTASAAAQGTITGTVTYADTDDSVPAVNVIVVGLNLGTATGLDGTYRIDNVPAGPHTLEVRFLGYKTTRKPVTVVDGQTATVNFSLEESLLEMDEVVVTGTGGNARRREIGNSIEQITAAQLEAAPIADFGDLLQGRAAGIMVMDNSGMAGAGSTIRLRGNNSISQGNEPLIYIDGVRVLSDNFAGDPELNQAPSPLNDINPDDIERIEIVKGAAATTLYGTEAAGGVIQIFTKRGAQGRPNWSFEVTQGFNNMGHVGPDSDKTGLGLNDCSDQPGCPSNGSWFRNGHLQSYNLSVRGGTEALTYFLSGRLGREEGVIAPQYSADYAVRGNFGFTPARNLSIRFNNAYSFRKTRWIPDGNNAEGLLLNVIRGERGYTPGNDDSKVLDMRLFTNTNHFTTGLNISWTPSANMLHRINAGLDFAEFDYSEERPWGFFYVPEGDREDDRYTYRNMTFDYAGSLDLRLSSDLKSSSAWGAQIYSKSFIQLNGFGEKFAGPGDKVVNSGAITEAFEDRISSASGGFFLQQRFGWQDRLFLTAGLRLDGHSTFGDNFGLAPYPKFSASYLVSEHRFWPQWWDTMKLRVAYGESGKAPDAFSSIRTWDSVSGDDGEPAVTPSNLGNPDLGPERTREVEFGFEGTLLDGRVFAELTVYDQRTYDALIAVQPTPSRGIPDTQLENVGELTNKGVEATLRLTVLDREKLRWQVGGYVSTNHSKAVDLGGLESISIGWRQYIRPGHPVPSYFHDVVTNPDEVGATPVMEEQYLGPSYPTHTYGLNMSATFFRRLTLDVIGEGQGGHVLSSGTAYQNVRRRVWPTCTAIQEQISAGDTGNLTARDRALCDTKYVTYGMWTQAADFFKLRSMAVSYRLPVRLLPFSVRGATLRLQARNLFTITDYPGLNPETFEDGSSGALYRQEYYNIPPARTFQFSLKVDF